MTDHARRRAATRQPYHRTHRTPERDRMVADAYIAGASLAELRDRFGYAASASLRVLRERGVVVRPRGAPRSRPHRNTTPPTTPPPDSAVPTDLGDRGQHMVALYDYEGHTLEQVGALYGVTRERARQIIARERERGRALPKEAAHRSTVDPIALLRVIRRPMQTNLSAAAREVRIPPSMATIALAELGVLPAVQRLYRMRRRIRRREQLAANRAHAIAQVQRFVATHGRNPTANDMLYRASEYDLPYASNIRKWFGGIPEALAAAGLPQNPRGYAGWRPESKERHRRWCQRGHDRTRGGAVTSQGSCRECEAIRSVQRHAARDPSLAGPLAHIKTAHPIHQRQVYLHLLGQLLDRLAHTYTTEAV